MRSIQRLFLVLSSTLTLTAPAHASGRLSVNPIKANAIDDGRLVIYQDSGWEVRMSPSPLDNVFEDRYVVSFANGKITSNDLERFGPVEAVAGNQFAVLKVAEDEVLPLSGFLHERGLPCGSLFQLRGDPVFGVEPAAPAAIHAIGTLKQDVLAATSTVDPERIRGTVSDLSSIHTRHSSSPTGQTVADLLAREYRALAGARDDVQIETFEHAGKTTQPSLVVRIIGRTKPDELIILGSHIDSIAYMSGTSGRSPGADDNASGTATNLEIFRVLMQQNWSLERTLEIHGYAAEEQGLVGSQDMAKKYRDQAKNVVAMVQHDMNIYRSGPADKIWLVSNNTNAALNTQLGQLIDQYAGVTWGTKVLSGGNSDHYSWTRQGYAAAFPFEDPANYNPHIHTTGDDLTNGTAFSQAAAFAKLGIAYVAHFAGNGLATRR